MPAGDQPAKAAEASLGVSGVRFCRQIVLLRPVLGVELGVAAGSVREVLANRDVQSLGLLRELGVASVQLPELLLCAPELALEAVLVRLRQLCFQQGDSLACSRQCPGSSQLSGAASCILRAPSRRTSQRVRRFPHGVAHRHGIFAQKPVNAWHADCVV